MIRTQTLNGTPENIVEKLATKIGSALLCNNRNAIKIWKKNGGFLIKDELNDKRLFQYINDQLGVRFTYDIQIQLLVFQNLPNQN